MVTDYRNIKGHYPASIWKGLDGSLGAVIPQFEQKVAGAWHGEDISLITVFVEAAGNARFGV
jgi:hypothetical protein